MRIGHDQHITDARGAQAHQYTAHDADLGLVIDRGGVAGQATNIFAEAGLAMMPTSAGFASASPEPTADGPWPRVMTAPFVKGPHLRSRGQRGLRAEPGSRQGTGAGGIAHGLHQLKPL